MVVEVPVVLMGVQVVHCSRKECQAGCRSNTLMGVFTLLAAGWVSHQDKRHFMGGHVVIVQQAGFGNDILYVFSTALSIFSLISGA